MIGPGDVGRIAGCLLALDELGMHSKQRYILSGPEDISGNDIIKLVENIIGEPVKEKVFKDTDWLQYMVKSGQFPAKALPLTLAGFECLWDGSCTCSGPSTSQLVLNLAAPSTTCKQALENMLGETRLPP